jgi:hypothetical protein
MSSAETAVPSISPATRMIELRGVRVHNLRQVDLDIPLGKLVVLSGVSGSGKSSLAFDTIFAEGQRRYIESFSASARQFLERIERPDADRIAHVPPAIAIRTDSTWRSVTSQATVASMSEINTALRRLFARIGRVICPGCGCEVRSQSAFDGAHAVNQLSAGTRFQVCVTPPSATQANDAATWFARGFSRAIIGGAIAIARGNPGRSRIQCQLCRHRSTRGGQCEERANRREHRNSFPRGEWSLHNIDVVERAGGIGRIRSRVGCGRVCRREASHLRGWQAMACPAIQSTLGMCNVPASVSAPRSPVV